MTDGVQNCRERQYNDNAMAKAVVVPCKARTNPPLSHIAVGFVFMKFSDAIEKFINRSDLERAEGTVKAYEQDLKRFCVFTHNPIITEITEENVVAYFRLLIELKYKKNAFIPIQQSLINFFRYWRRKGLYVLDHELIPRTKKEFRMPDVATEEDYRKMLAAIPQDTNQAFHIRNRAMVMFLEATGCRNGEMCSLNIGDSNSSQIKKNYLDLRNQKALIETEKNRGSRPIREIYWKDSKETHEALLKWIARRSEMKKHIVFKDPDALFVGCMGWQVGKRLMNSAVCIALRKISRSAGLTYNFHPHMLRHKFGHDLNREGANAFTIAGLLGHVLVESSKIYTEMDNKERQEAYVKYKGDRHKKDQ
ncbi:MAG: tyrosine-type recombinase/integrase [Patescibacteria group bacterium]|nr:tyrosine-type recombinase/integrase [Patescibacteria group bacterium]